MLLTYSEDQLIQRSTAELLEKELGWKSVYAFDQETLGETEEVKAKVIDFQSPEKNEFLCVREMWVYGSLYHRRADIMGFVNGIPLLFVELKNHEVEVEDAYNQNYRDYLDTIPQLFYYN